jgi:hypothetical protein
MKRREFIALLGGAAVMWLRAARAQQPGKKWLIGFIAHGHVKAQDALFEGLRELGYVEGRGRTSLSRGATRAVRRSASRTLPGRWFSSTLTS